METCRDKMIKLMLNQDVFTYFYIDYKNNCWHLEENPTMPEFSMSETENPIDSIIKSGKLMAEDVGRFNILADRLKSGHAFGKTDKYISTQFRLHQELGPVWYEIKAFPCFEPDGTVNIVSGTFHRLSDKEIKNLTVLRSHVNNHSSVFIESVERRIRESPDTKDAIIQFDVNGFKFINDKYGEAVGDELLHYINDVMDIYCNDDQLFSRLGADLFMVVISYEEISDIYDFIRGLEAAMSGYKGIKYTFAFGVCLAEDKSGNNTRVVGDSAGIARHVAKRNALENIAFFNKEEKNIQINRRSIEDRMKSALKNREFIMYLQPKFSISKSELIGAEALARWIDPEKGLIAPDDFIPLFEKNGFVVKIDEYIWECTCQVIRNWIDNGITPVPISVNVSRVNLNNSDFLYTLNGLIARYQIPKKYLELEITESAENINANAMIMAAKNQGFRLLMDDFGSGYSSLNTLKNTPFDVLKIDRSFLSSSMESQRGQKIISHTIAMSRDIGLDIIAEGVENREQADFLYSCGCDAAQGFLYSRPIPVMEFDKIMFEKEN